jgi:hypothetical protein
MNADPDQGTGNTQCTIICFFSAFLPLIELFSELLDPDPDSECGSGSRRPLNADPDPKQWVPGTGTGTEISKVKTNKKKKLRNYRTNSSM